MPALIESLKAVNKDVSRAAVDALGAIGPAAQEAVPALIALLNNKDSVLRAKRRLRWEESVRQLKVRRLP